MPYGILKADTLTYYTATGDVSVAISGIAISGSPLISGVSGIFTTSVSGATVTGNAGQFTTITGGTAQFTNITGVSGTFTSLISGATVTGTSGQFTTLTATTGVFTTSISGATISGDLGLFSTISGSQGFFSSSLSVPSGTAGSPSISFNGDSNTGIYSPGADQVAISTNGSQRFRISDAKVEVVNPGTTTEFSVGAGATGNNFAVINLIGDTTYPDFGFRVIRLNAGANASSQINHRGTGLLTLNAVDAGSIQLKTNDTERLRLTSDGLLGLGTSAPDTLFYVRTTTGNIAATIESAGVGPFLRFLDPGSSEWAVGVPDTSGALAFIQGRNPVTEGTERLRIDNQGRVGIGTTSPGALVDSLPPDSTVVYRARSSTTSAAVTALQVTPSDVSAEWLGVSTGPTTTTVAAAGNLVINTSGSERARIDSSGRLLVGTSTAFGQGLLQVNNSASIGSYFASPFSNAFYFVKSRSAAAGQVTVVQSGDELGQVLFQGTDGTTNITAAGILAAVDGTPGANDMPGRLVFSTTADGASSPTERVRISQNGVVTVKNGAVAEIGTLTDSGTITPDFAANCNFTATISGGSRTLANPSNITAGQTGSIFIIQGAGAGTISWGSYWDFAGGTAPTLTTTSGAVDRVDYVVRTSTSIHTVFTANYS